MHYKKIKTENAIIEFHNNWLGVETVIINGQIVSKKSSIMGANHYFTIFENGHVVPYILTTKLDSKLNVKIDLRQDGKLIQENLPVNYGTKEKNDLNEFKANGIKLLNEYEIGDAILALKKGLEFDKSDPEIYFYLACCYSIEEKITEGFECIKKSVLNNLSNKEMILNHEMLAFLRIQDAFEDFLNTNFMEYSIDEDV